MVKLQIAAGYCLPDCVSQAGILDTGYWILDTGYLDTGYLDTGYLDACKLFQVPTAYYLLFSACWSTGCCLLMTNNPLFCFLSFVKIQTFSSLY